MTWAHLCQQMDSRDDFVELTLAERHPESASEQELAATETLDHVDSRNSHAYVYDTGSHRNYGNASAIARCGGLGKGCTQVPV